MAITEALRLLIEFDGKGAIAGVKQFGTAADQNLKKAETGIDRVGSKLVKFGATSLAAGTVMAAGLYKAGQAASNLEQSIGGTDAVFKGATKTIDDFAKDSAQSVGLSERAFRQLATVAGASLKGMGFSVQDAADQSVNLVKIGADLAATFGGTTEDAVAALGATLRGEFDPAEKFGIALSANAVAAKAVEMGLAKSKNEVDASAKAQATLALIMERSADAQGQFGREADTAAGAQQRLKAEMENFQAALGTAVTPVLADAAHLLGEVTKGFNGLPEPVQALISKSLVLGTGLLLVGGGLSTAVGAAIKYRDVLTKLAERAGITGASLAGLKQVVGAAGVAAVGATVAFEIWDAKMAQLRKDADVLRGVVDRAFTAPQSLAEFNGRLEETRRQIADFRDTKAGSNAPWDADFRRGLDEGIATLEAAEDKYEKVKVAAEKLAAATGVSKDEALKMALGQQDVADAAGTAADAVDLETGAIDDLTGAVKTLFGSQTDAEQAQISVTKAVSDYTEAQIKAWETTDDAKTSIDEHAQATLDMQSSLLSADEAARRLADAQVKAAEDTAAASGATLSADEANAIYRDSLQKTAESLDPGSPLRDRLVGYIMELDKTEGTRTTLIQANVDEAIANIDRFVDSIFRMFGVTHGSHAGRSASTRIGVDAIPAAEGFAGTVSGPTPFIVGEGGRKEDVLIVPHSKGGIGGMSGGGNTYNITNVIAPGVDPVAVGRSTVEAIRAYERANGSSWRNN